MADVFISYASEDREIVAKIRGWLTARGYSVWWDQNLVAGDLFRGAIQAALKEARCAIVVWSTTSVRSDFVQDEAGEAHRVRRLIPVALSDIDVHDIPLGFRSLQTLRFDQGMDQLVPALQRFDITPSDVPAPPPEPRTDTIGRLTNRLRKMRKLQVSFGAVSVPITVVLLIAFPSFFVPILVMAGLTALGVWHFTS